MTLRLYMDQHVPRAITSGLRLRGVDHSRTYAVTLDNRGETFSMTGRELANSGLTIRLDGSMLSELVLYTVVP